MAARAKHLKQINLLPQEEFAASTTGRVLQWLLSTFRYLVIITEMVVISAFISRFYFDSRSTDLSEEMKQKENYIKAYLDFENQFKSAQQKLAIFSSMSDQNKKSSPLLDSIVGVMPKDIQLVQMAFLSATKLQVQASSLSERSVDQFVVNLSTLPQLQDVSLTQVDVKATSPYVNFIVQAKIKK
jgi:Tfp pilus assembly protein PilN